MSNPPTTNPPPYSAAASDPPPTHPLTQLATADQHASAHPTASPSCHPCAPAAPCADCAGASRTHFPTEEAYLAALSEWVEQKKYFYPSSLGASTRTSMGMCLWNDPAIDDGIKEMVDRNAESGVQRTVGRWLRKMHLSRHHGEEVDEGEEKRVEAEMVRRRVEGAREDVFEKTPIA